MVPVLSLADVYSARRRLHGRTTRSPLVHYASPSKRLRVPVLLKLETVQPTAGFKIRGFTNATSRLAESGVSRAVTAFTGNHGRAVAYASPGFFQQPLAWLAEPKRADACALCQDGADGGRVA
ncbi:hypothetical protein C7I87_27970 [Mesorhizobium sp. SARCC-RB16n]|uniref:pyridoxal-phosphate dependent enzyme n=1 Tax=Mesorhizobium sp. SARCC-RB16n TaxID=2116687 RepID=UPI00122F0132|nr:hypothetical protein C7I87_27970 [Mesorhizobium sp. SARCC-RB16n]